MTTQKLVIKTPEKTQLYAESSKPWSDSAPLFQGGLHPVTQLQRTLGNRRVAQLIQAKRLTHEGKIIGLQRKLTIGAADDQYEQEADRVARQVMNTSDAMVIATAERAPSLAGAQNQTLQIKPLAASITANVQRQRGKENEIGEDKDGEERQDESLQAKFVSDPTAIPLQRQTVREEDLAEPIQAKSAGSMAGSFEAGTGVETQLSLSKGRGSPLPDPVRAYMEPRFGVDFKDVRVHTGNEAQQMSQAVGAQAFTHGSDIYFGVGHSPANLGLTAHELTHVIQQTGSPPLQTKKREEETEPLSPEPSIQRISAVCAADAREESGTEPIDTIQGAAGNIAVQRTAREVGGKGAPIRSDSPLNFLSAPLIQRDQGPSPEKAKDASPSLTAFDAANPGIIAAMSFEQLKIWHDVITGWVQNRKVDEALTRHERHERSTFLDPASTAPIASSDYLEAHARIESRRKFVDEGKSRVPLAPTAILSPDISSPQAWNVDAEQRYRAWAVEHFASKPLEAELSTKPEIVSALEESQHPGLASGIPHVNLLWAGTRIKHTRGIVTWNDLMDIREFRDKYTADVTDSPEIKALRAGIQELDSHITHMKIEHQGRSDANAEHGIVRHISEAIGAPSQIELTLLRLKVQQNPGDLDAKAALAEKEAEAGDYPKMKDDEKGPGIWHEPDVQLSAARRFMKEGKFELAVAALTECEHSTALATAKFAGYERRVMKGASTAVKWLDRAKTAGKIASAFTGTGGVVRAAVGAAGYSFAQEGSQQVIAHWIDPSNKIDVKGLAQQAAIDGLATLFGGVTQGAFVNALTARFGARLVTKYGLSEGAARTVLSAAGATTSSFYNVPAKLALDKIIAGKAFPSSLADVCNMVTTEAVQSGALDVVGSYVHAHGAKTVPEPAVPHTGPEITAPHATVEALAGPEGAQFTGPRPAPSVGGPVRGTEPRTIISEARQVAGQLEPLRHEWSKLSLASRAQRLIDGVHQTLAATGVPKPVAIAGKKTGGLFHHDTWIIELEGSLLAKKNLSIEEFATACEIARHEMEHAMQFFRIARREHARTGEDAKTLAGRLMMPIDTVQAAIDANAGKRMAERIPAGGALDQSAAAYYENIYGTNKKRRNEVLRKLDNAFDAIAAAEAKLRRLGPKDDAVLWNKAIDDFAAVETTHRPIIEEYRNFPEEIPAYKAGSNVYHAVRQQARLADKLREARLDERRYYANAIKAWDEARRHLADPTIRVPPLARAAVKRAIRQWLSALDRIRGAEHELIRVLEGRSK